MTTAAAASLITPDMRARLQHARKSWNAIEPRLTDTSKKIAAAIKAGERELLMRLRRSIDAESRAASLVANLADGLISAVGQAQDAASGLDAASPELEKMAADASAISRAAGNAFSAGKRLMAITDEKLEAMSKSESAQERRWAKGDAFLRTHFSERSTQRKAMQALSAEADRAVAARDSKALDAVKKAAPGIGSFREPLASLRKDIAELDRLIDEDRISADLRKQFDADRKAWDTLLRNAEADEVQIKMERDMILALAIEPRDARKAAGVLGISGGDVAKLAKVLELDEAGMLKGLDALAKQLKLETSGKDMLAALRRARLV